MVALVDIYIRLIIAVLGFIAPTVTLLLPVLGARIGELKKVLIEQEGVLENIKSELRKEYSAALEQITNQALRSRLQSTTEGYISENTITLTKTIEDKKKQLEFLNLKKQIKVIFGSLILSLVSVMVYELIKVNLYGCFGLGADARLLLSLGVLLISLILFTVAIIVLWKLVCIIIDVRYNETNIFSHGNTNSNIPTENGNA